MSSSISSSPASGKVGSNQDLLIQIITRLPAKSVLRFKSLSKPFLSLIDEIQTQSRLGRNSRDPVHGIFLRMVPADVNANMRKLYHSFEHGLGNMGHSMHQYIPLNPVNNRPFSTKFPNLNVPTCPRSRRRDDIVVLSSNGLFLCYKLKSRESPMFYVYNPTTFSYTHITDHALCYTTIPVPTYSVDNYKLGMTLAFDPVTSPHYKIIFVWKMKNYLLSGGYEIGIYSSETGTWSGAGGITISKVDGGSSILLKDGVYWNGSVHWISTSLEGAEISLRFHIDTLSFYRIPKPPVRTNFLFECANHYFGETGGHLHYIDSRINNCMDIYEMKADYTEWFVKYKVNLTEEIKKVNIHDNLSDYRSFDLLSLVRFEDEEEKGVLVLWVGNEVIKCNVVNGKINTLAEFWNGYEPGPKKLRLKHAGYRGLKVMRPTFVLENGFPFNPSLAHTNLFR